MSGFHKIIPCAAIAALVFAGSSRITGQAPVENGRPIALAAAEDTLPAALERVDAMLTSGELNISQLHDDTLIPGRAIERLGQYYEGLPVFGGHVVRQMDGRAVVSVTGRLYESLALDVNPSISPERASAVAVAAVGPGANVRGDATLGILPVENGYRLVYRMKVLSDWAIRDVYVAADSGDVLLSVNGIHTQAAVGQGSGIFGTLRKMSTNQTSSTYQAVDKLRPAEAFTLAFPGTPSRLNLFLQTLVLFNSDVATDSDNFWTDGPTVDAHVSQGFVYDYYFKRFSRHGMDDREIEVDSYRAPTLPIGSQSAAAGCRQHVHQQRLLLLRWPAGIRRRRRSHLEFSCRRLRRRRARMDARGHRLYVAADLPRRAGRLERSFLGHHGRRY